MVGYDLWRFNNLEFCKRVIIDSKRVIIYIMILCYNSGSLFVLIIFLTGYKLTIHG